MTLGNRSYTAGAFELQLDGHTSSAYVKSVDGGMAKAAPITEAIGPYQGRVKHNGPVEIEPMSMEVGLSGAGDIARWIQGSWDRQFSRRNGQVTHANDQYEPTFEHQFTNALITETTFPSLDGSSKEPGYLKVKIQPEKVEAKKSTRGGKIGQPASGKQKMWLCSSFRFALDGIDEMDYVNKLDSFTIKQGVKAIQSGSSRWAEYEPTKIEYPALTGTIALAHADKLLKWHDESVMKGMTDPSQQRSGCIEFLSPDRKTVLFAIDLMFVGITSVSMVPVTANSDQIKRLKFELYVESMKLDPMSGMAA